MDLVECIEKRHSVRDYKNEPIPDDFVQEALRMAVLAPSAGNLQVRDFIVVKDGETKSKLVAAAHGQKFLSVAPIVIICCANLDRISSYGLRGRELYCLQDVAASIEHIMLYATSRGYGSCWVGAFDERVVSGALGLPNHIRPIAMISIGVPAREGKQPRRMPIEAVVHREKW